MAASSNRTMIDGIYTDMIIGVDTTTPAQRVNVTWGDNNLSEGLPVEVSFDASLISSYRIRDELIELNKQMKILNKYLSNWHGEEITSGDIENDSN